MFNTMWRNYGAWGLILASLLATTGCLSESESLYELEHIEPPHWPTSVRDLGDKIQVRLDQYPLGDDAARLQTAAELVDLIEWTPEIVGDTELGESEWNEIYARSEAIRKRLRAGEFMQPDVQSAIGKLVTSVYATAEHLDASRFVPPFVDAPPVVENAGE